jgi:hypothetical protein
MAGFTFRVAPNTVFTPGELYEKNKEAYIPRTGQDLPGEPTIETRFRRELAGGRPIVVCGEQGLGKTWLFAKVLGDLDVPYVEINCGRLENEDSLDEALHRVREGYRNGAERVETAVTEKAAPIGFGFDKTYRPPAPPGRDELIRWARERAVRAGQFPCIVFDNIEMIAGGETSVLGQLRGLVVDSTQQRETRALQKVQIILVGTAASLDKMIRLEESSSRTVSRRLSRLPELRGLSPNEVLRFVELSFNSRLGAGLTQSELDQIAARAHDATDGVPNDLHEYCQALANLMATTGEIAIGRLLDRAEREWLLSRPDLVEDYAPLAPYLNLPPGEEQQRILRVLFHLAQSESHIDIRSLVEMINRKVATTSHQADRGTVGTDLGLLTRGSRPVLRRLGIPPRYRFARGYLRLLIRELLQLQEGGEVAILPISNGSS